MNLKIDTINKTITIEDSKVNFEELFKTLNELFPNDEWKKFSLIPNYINNIYEPLKYEPYGPLEPYQPNKPWWDGPHTPYC